MAYQQTGGMGSGPPHGGNEHAPPQGTEYTLQGVMRFLQIEWHNHERARNAWDIERAEMKAKIAKQEGELRSSKRLAEQLSRHVKMLEIALRNERTKSRDKGHTEAKAEASLTTTTAQEASANSKGAESKPPLIPHNSFLETLEPPETTMEEREQYKDKSRKYLEKCMQEIQYLLSPPPHPAPSQLSMQNVPLPGLPEPPPSLDDVLIRQRQQRSMQAQSQQISQAAAVANHQVPDASRQSMPQTSAPLQESPFGAREQSVPQQLPRASDSPAEPTPQLTKAQMFANEEPVETITHSFDSYGRAVNNTQESSTPQTSATDNSDGWNFGEPSQVLPDPSGHETPGSRRPDTDVFPSATNLPAAKSPPRAGSGSHRRRSSGAIASGRRRSSGSQDTHDSGVEVTGKQDPSVFKVKFALRGHLDVVRSVIFTGGGSPSEPEICTAGDDGSIKRWIIPSSYANIQGNHAINDLDIACYFTHRGHDGLITSLAACPSTSFSTGGRASGDGWIFSGGQDATIRVWERGRVDPKATLDGHTDAIWSICVLPGNVGTVFGTQSSKFGGPERILLVSGSADGTVKVWAVSAPPQTSAAPAGARRGVGGSRRHSVTSGSNHPNSPQPTTATNTPFHHTLLHSIQRPADSEATPTSICALSPSGENFVVSYTDSCVLVFDTRTGEEVIGMASNETYDGTRATSINAVVATSSAALSIEPSQGWNDRTEPEEALGAGPTGSAQGVEGVVVSGHEDRYIRFFDANSGQCTYSMLAHPSAISSLSLSHDGHEAVSAGHDASIRFWSLDKRICTQDITSHRPMRGEGVCSVVWSQDGRYVVSAGGDGVVKVFAR